MEDFFDRFQRITGVSKYSTSEVITPSWVVSDMVDLLPSEVFAPESRFLDPSVKSGRFLAEIYRRLMNSEAMKQAFPNEQDRQRHILANQLYGFATSGAAAAIARKQLYDDPTIAGNIHYTTAKDVVKEIQGALENMKFDVVIGNPPYNRGMDIDFVKLGFDLSKQYTVMITPAKWQTAEADQSSASKMSYGDFRKQLVPHIREVVFYPDAKDLFDIIEVDGITYFLMSKDTYTSCKITNKCKNYKKFNDISNRSLLNQETLYNKGMDIIAHMGSINSIAFHKNDFSKRYKVVAVTKAPGMSHSNNEGHPIFITSIYTIDENFGGQNDRECIFSSDSIEECKSFISYMYTRLVRFLYLCNTSKLTNPYTNHCFRFVPAPGAFDHIFTDQELYQKYGLTADEIAIIESVIKERK